MKTNRIAIALLFGLGFFALACQKEVSLETGALPPPLPLPQPDTAVITQPVVQPVAHTLKNPSFEDSLRYWKIATKYRGRNGFKARGYAAHTGKLGLSFYAAQRHHYNGAKQETPWNGKIYKRVPKLKDGRYTFRIWASAVGDGMYLWANGGAGEVTTPIRSSEPELHTLDFEVKGGVAEFGFICIDAGGTERFAPYFEADDAEFLKY